MANQELLAEGIWPCIVLTGSAGEELDKNGTPTGRMKARVSVKFDDGPSKGRIGTYEDEVNARSSLYIARSLKAVGWQGRSLTTVEADVAAWVKRTGGKSTAEVRHIDIKKGKRFDEWVDADNKWIDEGRKGERPAPPIWDKVNSIGRGPKPLAAPSGEALSDADEAMRRAWAEMHDAMANPSVGTPPDDAPPNMGSAADDDIPFATCSPVSLGEIARVLR